MTIDALISQAKAGNVSQEDATKDTLAEGSSSVATASPALSSPVSMDEYIPTIVPLQSPQDWLTSAPTFTPQSFQDQIQFVFDGTDYWIYFYANNQWNKAAASGGGGVSSIIAGSGIAVSGATGNVTISATGSGHGVWYVANNPSLVWGSSFASGTLTVPHPLGVQPAFVRITAWCHSVSGAVNLPVENQSVGAATLNFGSYTMYCSYSGNVSGAYTYGNDNSNIVHILANLGSQTGAIRSDSSHLYIDFTENGSPSFGATIILLIEMFA